jgi:hypothetical protein
MMATAAHLPASAHSSPRAAPPSSSTAGTPRPAMTRCLQGSGACQCQRTRSSTEPSAACHERLVSALLKLQCLRQTRISHALEATAIICSWKPAERSTTSGGLAQRMLHHAMAAELLGLSLGYHQHHLVAAGVSGAALEPTSCYGSRASSSLLASTYIILR